MLLDGDGRGAGAVLELGDSLNDSCLVRHVGELYYNNLFWENNMLRRGESWVSVEVNNDLTIKKQRKNIL
jgi:hypothetical protein